MKITKKVDNALKEYLNVLDKYCSVCTQKNCKHCIHYGEKVKADNKYIELARLIRGTKQ